MGQAFLELEGKQRVASESKLEGQYQAVLSSVYDEVSDLRRGVRDMGTSNDFRTLRLELDREIRHCFEELSKSVHMNQTNAHESSLARLSEILRRVEDEREERQREVKSIHQEIITIAEQTSLSLDEEASRLWEALQSHNHDIIMDGDNSSLVGNVQIQSMANKAGIKPPRKIQLKQSLNSSMTTSRSKLHQTDGKGAHHQEANIPQQQEKSQCQTNGKGVHQQEKPASAGKSSPKSHAQIPNKKSFRLR